MAFFPEEKSCTYSDPAWLGSSQELQQEVKHRPALWPLCHCSRRLSASPLITWPSNSLFTGRGTVRLQVPAGSALPGHLSNCPDRFLYGPGPYQSCVSSLPQSYISSHPHRLEMQKWAKAKKFNGKRHLLCSFLSREGKLQKTFPSPSVVFFLVETEMEFWLHYLCSQCH